MGRRLVVSYIHGRLERFRRALQLACYCPDSDGLFLLGDYIERGSDSEGVLKVVRSMVRDGAVALKGNDEDMMIRAASDPAWLRMV